jgi:hypothetical protein
VLGGCSSTARSAHSVIKMDSAGSGTTGWHTSTACFGFEYLDADWGANAALNHTEDLSMNELAGTAASHGTGRNTIDGAGLSRIAEGCRGPAPGSWRRQERPSCAERALAQSAVGLRAAPHSMRTTFKENSPSECDPTRISRLRLQLASGAAHPPAAAPTRTASTQIDPFVERERGQ